MNLEDKIDIVKNILKDKKVAIGFSGGADSTLIAYLSSMVAKDTLAITIDNHLMPTNFIEHGKKACDLFQINHIIIDIDFYKDADFLLNGPERCFTCRELMYSKIESVAQKNNFDFICDGNNISDLIFDRPGILITYEKEFETPLIEARLTSKEIHEYLNKKDIPYSRSTTCLATRIPTDTPTTEEKISRISYCEDYIQKATSCEIVKVRDFEKSAVVEVDNINKILKNNQFRQINEELKKQGFEKVVLNLSEIDDAEYIKIYYNNGSFSYQLPFSINMKDTHKQLENEVVLKSDNQISIENFIINENGLIEGHGLKDYETALDLFMNLLKKLRRNI